MPSSAESYLRTSAEHLLGLCLLYYKCLNFWPAISNKHVLLGYATVTQGESRRGVQLANLILIELENEGPKPNKSAPCMIMSMRQGKQNQHSKVEYIGCMQNADPILCPLSALAFYFFNRWGKDSAKEFPSFRQPKDYYNLYVFPSSVKVPQRPLNYSTQLE
jgi:hypothetical protein